MEGVGTILLHIRIADLRARIWFGRVDKLDLNVLLGTVYIDNLIKGILPMEPNLFTCRPWQSLPATKLHHPSEHPSATASRAPLRRCKGAPESPMEARADITVRVVEAQVIPPISTAYESYSGHCRTRSRRTDVRLRRMTLLYPNSMAD